MISPEFLEPDAVLFLHDQAVREFGGLHGVRDEDLLNNALARPVNRFAYAGVSDVDLFDLAAAYAFGLARSHPFRDGNKRTAWSACVLFLKMNGAGLRVPAPDVIEQMVALAAGSVDETVFAAWLRG